MDFALKVFKDLPEKISIPTKCQPSLINKVHFNTLHTELDSLLMNKVLEISSHTSGICLNSLLMACYFKLMNLWSGQMISLSTCLYLTGNSIYLMQKYNR